MANTATQSRPDQKNDPATNVTTAKNTWQANLSPEEIQQRIEYHKTSAEQLQTASRYHFEAVKHLENGDQQKAMDCANKAQDSMRNATDAQQTMQRQTQNHQAL